MNVTVLVGRVSSDIKLSYLPNSETAVANFSMAVDRKVGKGKEKQADFVNIVVFGKSGEYVSQYSTKGKLIAIQGRLQIRPYEAKDGSKRSVTEVVADDVQILEWATDKKKDSGYRDMEPVHDGEIPF